MPTSTTSETSSDLRIDWPAQPSRATLAWRDLTEGLGKSWLWMALAMQDIKLRYRGSMLGPFWLTISTVIMVAAMGVIYARLFRMDMAHYLSFLAVGLVLWQFVSTVITDGCTTFTTVQPVIQQVRMPFSVHAYRMVYRNLIVLAHNAIIIPFVMVIFQVPLDWSMLLIVPALLVLAINGVWIGILFGMLSARFRDVPPIVASFVQVVFFITPIFWSADLLGSFKGIAELNPLFAAVDVIRAPLIGVPTAPHSWAVLLALTVVGCVGTFAIFARFRSRIAFWV